MRYPLTNNPSFICHPFLPSHHFQYKELQNTTRQIDRSISQTFFREEYSFFNVVSTWKCVLRMFTLASKAHCIKDTEHDMFHILDTNDTVEGIQVACDRFKSTFPSFELHKGRLLRDLFNSIRTKSSLTLHKLELLKCMLQGFENAAVEEAIYHSMNCCDKIEEATLLLVIFNSILITPNNHVLPPITTLHNLYKESHVDPNDAILSFKRKMYREEINRIIDIQIKNHCRINATWQRESSVLGSEKRGDDVIQGSMSYSNTPLHVSAEGENPSSFGVDVNKLPIFLDEVIRSEPPNSGWDLLLLDKTECYKFYRDALDKKLAFIRDESVSCHENSFKKQEGTPKLTMLASSRQHQLQHVCQCVMMWETKQIDNIQRMNDLLTLGSNINYRSVLPLQKANEDVVQSLCRDVYIDPDDNPDYDPPDSNVSGKMMRQMIHSKCENKRSFVPTDLETRKDELEKLAKDFEPYDHLTPEELSDVFLKNTKKEYELAVATYKRRIRNRSVEDYEEKRELEAGIRDLEVEEVAKRKRPDGNMVSDVYNKARGEYLTELLYYISLLEHLQWHFFASVNLPMESLVDVKEIGYSPTNPRLPDIKFDDPLCAEGSIHSKYFLSERGGASNVRKWLTVGGSHNTKADAKQGNQLLLFGDDPLFFVKDQEMLQHMLQCGIGLEIHSKVPGFVLPSEPTEFQKDTSYYRLSTTQPQCLIICSNCGYNIFSHSIKTHDGEKLDGREYDILASNDDAKCASCNGSVNINHEYWITGSRGYCYEPYPTPIADEL